MALQRSNWQAEILQAGGTWMNITALEMTTLYPHHHLRPPIHYSFRWHSSGNWWEIVAKEAETPNAGCRNQRHCTQGGCGWTDDRGHAVLAGLTWWHWSPAAEDLMPDWTSLPDCPHQTSAGRSSNGVVLLTYYLAAEAETSQPGSELLSSMPALAIYKAHASLSSCDLSSGRRRSHKSTPRLSALSLMASHCHMQPVLFQLTVTNKNLINKN